MLADDAVRHTGLTGPGSWQLTAIQRGAARVVPAAPSYLRRHMQILKSMTIEQKAEIGEKVIRMFCDTASMDLKEKEQWLSHIPKDYKLDNDMTIMKFRLWTEIREDLVKQGYLGVRKEDEGQQTLEI